MGFRRQVYVADLEKDLLTAFITSSSFTQQVRRAFSEDYFEGYGKIVSKWAVDYWDQYHDAPGRVIQNIYNVEKDKLQPALAEGVALFLEGLSDAYDEELINVPYLVNQAYEHFKYKSHENLYTRGRELILAGRKEEATQLLEDFRSVVTKTSRWENPFSAESIEFLFDEEDTSEVFTFHGALGELIGPLERGWLFAFLGPMKRGKSFLLQECVYRALASKRKVACINLEMTRKGVLERAHKRLTGTSSNISGHVQFPVFDCQHNQYGTCPITKLRKNDITLITNEHTENKPKWGDPGFGDYRVCDACRDDPKLRGYYIPDVWYIWHKPKIEYSKKTSLRLTKGFMRQYGDHFRQITYPAFSVTIDEIRRDIDELRFNDGFHPDQVVVDYADIVASSHRNDERAHLNAIWKQMKGAAGDMGSLWTTASQTNRNALDKENVGTKDIAEDIRKLAHVDVMAAINQTAEDKEELFTRISCIAHRHRNTSERKQVAVLQQLELGLPYLDSEFWGF